jgi:biopolymer transport protein ExbD
MEMNKVMKIVLLSILLLFISYVAFFYLTTAMSKPTNFFENSSNIEKAKADDYDNCIILAKDNAEVVSGRRKYIVGYDSLTKDLKAYMKELKQREIKIIMTKDVQYQKLVDVLDIMTIEKVPQYKLLGS